MKNLIRSLSCLIIGIGLMGCAGLSNIKKSVSEFDKGVHTVSTNEMNFFRTVQSVDCSTAFYIQASDWASGVSGNFDLSGACKPTVLTDGQVKLRQVLMDSLTLYADRLEALSSGNDYGPVDSNAQKLSDSVAKLTTQFEVPTKYPIAKGVKIALNALSAMLLDQKRFIDIREAVTAASPSIESIVRELKTENTLFAMSMVSKIGDVHIALRSVVASTRKDRGNIGFFDIIVARQILQSSNLFGTTSISTTQDPSAKIDPVAISEDLNRSLDAVLTANRSILTEDPMTIKSAVDDLIALVRLAK